MKLPIISQAQGDSRGRPSLTFLTLAAVLALAVLPGCKAKTEVKAPADASADILDISPRDVGTVVERKVLAGVRVTGTLNPAVRVEVKAQVGGQLNVNYVDRGTVVTQQQVLAVQEDQATRAQMESIKSQLSAAERDFNASELLFKAGAASERTYVNSKVSVDSAKAQLTQVQQNVDRATVRSPLDGVISERAVSAGESVNPGQKLYTVVNSENLECAVSVLPPDMVNIRIGQAVYLALTSYPGRRVEGRVERIDPTADPKSRRIGVYIHIPNTNRSLFSGLFATGIILTNSVAVEQKSLLIPSTAVQDNNGVQSVFAIEGDKLVKRDLVLLPYAAEEGLLEVQSGIPAGAKVLLSPSADLKPDTKVRISEAVKAPK